MNELKLAHPPGHFYSPINDTGSLDRQKLDRKRKGTQPAQLVGLSLPLEKFRRLWRDMNPNLGRAAFSFEKSSERYYLKNDFYGVGDAAILFCMMAYWKPSRFIEIGSGFSSACALDTTDRLKLMTEFTFIEPFDSRLKQLLRPEDLARCTVLNRPVQEVDLSVFDALNSNDFLFIDSTHVVKTGSDVNFELFDVLPRLKSGVIIHFHDIFWPFEYPTEWIFERGYSWNEVYAVRAFLTFNYAFEVIFFNDLFKTACQDLLSEATLPEWARHLTRTCGGGLWLRKVT